MKRSHLSAAVLLALALAGCTAPVTANPPTSASDSPGVSGAVSCDYAETGGAAREVQPPAADAVATGTTAAVLTLNDTAVALTLDNEAAPCTVNSFVSLAQQGYFDDTSCHRVVDEGIFVLQCGDPSGTGSGGPGYSVPDEFEGITGYPAGTLAMANSGQPNSGGSQFFIVFDETPLPAQYTVFGTTDQAGIDLAAAIAAGGNDGSFGAAGGGKPLLPAQINSITVS